MMKTQIREKGNDHNIPYAVLSPAVAEKLQGCLGSWSTQYRQEESGSRVQHAKILFLPEEV